MPSIGYAGPSGGRTNTEPISPCEEIEETHTWGAFLLLVPRFSATQEPSLAGWPHVSSSIEVPMSLEIAWQVCIALARVADEIGQRLLEWHLAVETIEEL